MNLIKISAYLFITLSIIFFTYSCTKESEIINNENLKIAPKHIGEQLKKKSVINKKQFLKLSFEEQKEIWIDRLSNFLETDIVRKEKDLIQILISDLENLKNRDAIFFDKNSKNIIFELVKIVPTERFKFMFASLNNYETKVKFDDYVDKDFVTHFKLNFKLTDVENNNTLDKTPWRDCNCRWSCPVTPVGCVHSSCHSTGGGCGFLWLQSCTNRTEMVANDLCADGNAIPSME